MIIFQSRIKNQYHTPAVKTTEVRALLRGKSVLLHTKPVKIGTIKQRLSVTFLETSLKQHN